MTTEPYRVGLLLDGDSLQRWEADALETLVTDTDAVISVVLINDAETTPADRVRGLAEDGLWGSYRLTRWGYRLASPAATPWYRERKPLDYYKFLSAERTPVSPICDGLWNELPPDAVETLSQTDIGVRFGFGLLKGEALTAPADGVLSYHHGDIRSYRGQPPGFWEYIHDEPTTGVTVQRLSETLDGGEVVATESVALSDAETWGEVKVALFDASVPMLARAVDTVRSGTPTTVPEHELDPLYTTPDWRDTLRYLSKTTIAKLL
jgi:hypothetical protein